MDIEKLLNEERLKLLREQNEMVSKQEVLDLADALKRVVANWDDIQVGRPTSPQLVMMLITDFCRDMRV